MRPICNCYKEYFSTLYMSSTKYYAPYNMYAPDGSTFQLQYAKIASEKGSTSIAITNGKIGVLMAYNPTHNKLALPSLNKITKIGKRGLFAFAGITNDGLEYIRYLNKKVLEENITKDREIHPVYVFDDLCYAVAYRALSGYRLMGAAGILMCEYNQRICVTELSPNGKACEMYGTAIGHRNQSAKSILSSSNIQINNLGETELIDLCYNALKNAYPDENTLKECEIEYYIIKVNEDIIKGTLNK